MCFSLSEIKNFSCFLLDDSHSFELEKYSSTYLEVAPLRLNFLQPGVDHLQRVGTGDGVDQEEGVPWVTFLDLF